MANLKKQHMENSRTSTKIDKIEIVWKNVVILTLLHFVALQGIYYVLCLDIYWKTFLFAWIYGVVGAQGTTAVHRLWSHKAYKANLPLRIIFCYCNCITLQGSIHEWVRDHRGHHAFTDTNADPYNSKRGFFFCHIGWILCRKHPDVIEKGKKIDLSDINADSVAVFQKKCYWILAPFLSLGVPTLVPWYFWNENIYLAFAVAGILRLVITLHFTWSVNSFAHMYGFKPFDSSITPADNSWVSLVTAGEGWHNYHHVFPWDYRASELGAFSGSFSTSVIEFFEKIGWAYELRTVNPNIAKEKKITSGDVSPNQKLHCLASYGLIISVFISLWYHFQVYN